MYSLLNLGSLILGLVAWILPVTNLVQRNKNHKKLLLYATVSMSACGLALFFQIVYLNYLVRLGDWTALIDTSGAVVWLSFTLVIVTLLLNIIAVTIYNKKWQSKSIENRPVEL